MSRLAALALLVALAQGKDKLISAKDAIAATRPQATKWNEKAYLVKVECLSTTEGSYNSGEGKWAGSRVVWAAPGEKLGEIETMTYETFDGGVTWKDPDKSVLKSSVGLQPLPEKYSAPQTALGLLRKGGLKAKLPSIALVVERGAPVWVSTNAGEPVVVVDAVGGKLIGAVSTTLEALLDGVVKPCGFAEASAAIQKLMTDWGVTEWGFTTVSGKAVGVSELPKALLMRAWTIEAETKTPSAVRIQFGFHNGRISGWTVMGNASADKTTPPADLQLDKAAGYVAAHPFIVDWAKPRLSYTVTIDIEPERMKAKEVRVRFVDEKKTDSWAQAILDGPTGRVKDFIKQ